RLISSLSGDLHKEASSSTVKLTNLDGRAHGGKIAGAANIKLQDPIVYEVGLELDRIDLKDIFNAGITDKDKLHDVVGLLSGNITLDSTGSKIDDIKAEGKIEITNAKLYKLPVLLGLLHVVYLTLPQKSAFKEGTIEYKISKSRLVISEIWLNGNALSMVGSGYMDLKTKQLRLNFFTGPPGRLPVISKIGGELLKLVVNQLEMTRVTGTLDKPKIETVILPGVTKIVEILTSPGKEQ
ncbi:MAG TPA: hypothetical protein ENL03_01705, partial [Phycisphaerae bacterium]|nr:hypothetical protein [Phycisphaerae bacterium]